MLADVKRVLRPIQVKLLVFQGLEAQRGCHFEVGQGVFEESDSQGGSGEDNVAGGEEYGAGKEVRRSGG